MVITILQPQNLIFQPRLDIHYPYSQSGFTKKEQGSLNGCKAEKSETEREDKEQIGPGSLCLVLESFRFFNEF